MRACVRVFDDVHLDLSVVEADRSTDRQADRQAGRKADRRARKLLVYLFDCMIYRHTDRQADI